MAVVPYSPVPQPAQQLEPIRKGYVWAPPDAFGANIGQALGTLGRTTEQAGNEVTTRALALQQLNNEAEARQAGADYDIQVGKLHANFVSLQGKDAGPDALDKFSNDASNLRNTIRSGLSNPMAQKMFDADSYNMLGRSIFNAAGHSAQQMKVYADGTAQSQIKAAQDAALDNPLDERSFEAGKRAVTAGTLASGQIHGLSDEEIQNNTAENLSNLTASRITGLARTNPIAAKQMFNDAIKSGDIRGMTIARVDDTVNRGLFTTSARNTSDGINNGTSMVMGKGIVSIDRAEDAIGSIEHGNKYELRGPLVTQGQYKGQYPLGRYGIMEGNLPEWLKESGLPSMTSDEFLKNHDAQDKVFSTIFGGYMQKYGNFNDAAAKWLTDRTLPEGAQFRTDQLGTNGLSYVVKANAILGKSATLQQKVAAGRDEANRIAPDQPLLGDYVEQRIIADHNQAQDLAKDTYNTSMLAINKALIGAKQPVNNLDQLRQASPEAAAALDNLNSTEQLKLAKSLAKGDALETPENVARFNQIVGMRYNPDAFQDFMKINPMEENLTRQQANKIVSMQQEAMKSAAADPKIAQAMSFLHPLLRSAGIDNDENHHDDYDKFQGAMAQMLEAFTADKKRPPNYEETMQMGKDLLQQHVISHGWFGDKSDFSFVVPDEEAEKIKAMPQWGGKTPSDFEIEQIYARALYNQLYPAKQP